MWADPHSPLTYLEVPRAGSTSVKETICGHHNHDLEIEDKFVQISRKEAKIHLKENREFFTVIRDPWSRLYSSYNLYCTFAMRIRELRVMYGKSDAADLPGFDVFVEHLGKKGKRNHHWHPMTAYMPLPIERIDHILTVNWLNDEWEEKIRSKYPHLLPMRHERVGHNWSNDDADPLRFYSSQDQIDRVAEYYQADIEAFGFEIPNLTNR